MRPNRWLWSGAAALAVPLAFFEACSSSSATHQNPPEEQPGEDATTTPPDEQAPPQQEAGPTGDGACDLKASGLQFSSQTCQDCMQANCCALTIACTITDKTCAALQQCYIDCPKGTGGGGGGGDGGKDGGKEGGGGDGGGAEACRAACEAKYPGAISGAKAYNDCITGPCGPQCVGTPVPDAGGDGGKDGGPKDAGDAG